MKFGQCSLFLTLEPTMTSRCNFRMFIKLIQVHIIFGTHLHFFTCDFRSCEHINKDCVAMETLPHEITNQIAVATWEVVTLFQTGWHSQGCSQANLAVDHEKGVSVNVRN